MSAPHAEPPIVIGTGLITVDLVVSEDTSRPAHAWTGGTCGNVLTILSFLGWRSFPLARLNGDAASQFVLSDMARWGVRLDYAQTAPTCATPIIVQVNRRDKLGEPLHRFSWSCPHCGSWLPSYKAVPARSLESVYPQMPTPHVFFMDRLSRGALDAAKWAAESGALVVFEPSGKLDPKQLREALRIVHVVKYANDRVADLEVVEDESTSVLLEIQTSGAEGLKYRSRSPGNRASRWTHLPALRAPRLLDTCGAGDWATAGLIVKVGGNGLAGFHSLTATTLRDALKFGQALSAWNCGFEGARGGMYRVDKACFEDQVQRICEGGRESVPDLPLTASETPYVAIPCPACPSSAVN